MVKLHRAVFENDIKLLSSLIKQEDVNEKDKFGNTALHLAVMLGRKECIQLLLAHGARVKIKNDEGWTVLCEALSYGDRTIITSVYRKLRQQMKEKSLKRRSSIVKALNSIEDFEMELKWDFHTWVPILSHILPSDVCRIMKKGTKIRVDTTIGEVTDVRFSRGEYSFLFDLEGNAGERAIIVDRKKQKYRYIDAQVSEGDVEDTVDELMRADIACAQMSTKNMQFERAQRGFFWKEDKKETIGSYECDIYSIQGLTLEIKRRQEHLSAEELNRNNALIDGLNTGEPELIEESVGDEPRKCSLAPPPTTDLTFEKYLNSTSMPVLGRKHKASSSSKSFKPTVAMAESFPLSLETLLSILEAVAPVRHTEKLRKIVKLKLPPGFPVKIDVPIWPTVTARVTFQDFKFSNTLSCSDFDIPRFYTKDVTMFRMG
ncbi:ankyrin repeat domain-containing protein 13C-like [Artemia franciscana]|uniref:ankyrin repeat domain-containing protein 13C-like n=1 Tax=Artemia franciscana TaxID=6661 RepID=UPI0032DB5E93